MRSALEAYDQGESSVFLLHAGIALEHLLKARLANLNPALLSKGGKPQSAIWFADESKHDGVIPTDLRTISLDESLTLVRAIGVPLNLYEDGITALREHRNGVAHFVGPSDPVAVSVLVPVLQTMILLSTDLDVDAADFFGDFSDFVLTQVDTYRQEEERVYEGRRAQAWMRFDSQHGGASEEVLVHLRQLAEVRWHRRAPDDQLIDCPVCGLPAYANGNLEQVGWDVDYGRDGHPEAAYPSLEYTPYELQCPTCGLRLDTPGLVDLSGAFEDWQLPEADYMGWIHEYEEELRAEQWDEFR